MCPTGDTNTNGRDHSQCCWMQRVGRVVHLCLIKSRISWVHTRKPQILRTQTITHTGESNKMGHTDLRGLISPSYTHKKFKKLEYSLFFYPSLSLSTLSQHFFLSPSFSSTELQKLQETADSRPHEPAQAAGKNHTSRNNDNNRCYLPVAKKYRWWYNLG